MSIILGVDPGFAKGPDNGEHGARTSNGDGWSTGVECSVWEKWLVKLLEAFLPREASAERGDATVSRPSVRLSVCLSVRP